MLARATRAGAGASHTVDAVPLLANVGARGREVAPCTGKDDAGRGSGSGGDKSGLLTDQRACRTSLSQSQPRAALGVDSQGVIRNGGGSVACCCSCVIA